MMDSAIRLGGNKYLVISHSVAAIPEDLNGRCTAVGYAGK